MWCSRDERSSRPRGAAATAAAPPPPSTLPSPAVAGHPRTSVGQNRGSNGARSSQRDARRSRAAVRWSRPPCSRRSSSRSAPLTAQASSSPYYATCCQRNAEASYGRCAYMPSLPRTLESTSRWRLPSSSLLLTRVPHAPHQTLANLKSTEVAHSLGGCGARGDLLASLTPEMLTALLSNTHSKPRIPHTGDAHRPTQSVLTPTLNPNPTQSVFL